MACGPTCRVVADRAQGAACLEACLTAAPGLVDLLPNKLTPKIIGKLLAIDLLCSDWLGCDKSKAESCRTVNTVVLAPVNVCAFRLQVYRPGSFDTYCEPGWKDAAQLRCLLTGRRYPADNVVAAHVYRHAWHNRDALVSAPEYRIP